MSPRAPRIDRDKVISAAMGLIDEAGVDHLTMRRLGAALGVDPMAVYRLFASKDDVITGLVEQFWATLDIPMADESGTGPGPGDWQHYTKTVMMTIHEALGEHPGLIPVIATHPIATPAAMVAADSIVGRVLNEGAPLIPGLVDLLNSLILVTITAALGDFTTPVGHEPQEAPEASADFSALPNLGRLVTAGWEPSQERQFEHLLDTLLTSWFDDPGSPDT